MKKYLFTLSFICLLSCSAYANVCSEVFMSKQKQEKSATEIAYEESLLESIPVVKALEVEILEVKDKEVKLIAPLTTNINYEGTAFGGSINTLAVLSSYLMTHHLIKSSNINHDSLVIQKSSIEYLKPVTKDFVATATLPSEKEVQKFLKSLKTRGMGRIKIHSTITEEGGTEPHILFEGSFVATLPK